MRRSLQGVGGLVTGSLCGRGLATAFLVLLLVGCSQTVEYPGGGGGGGTGGGAAGGTGAAPVAHSGKTPQPLIPDFSLEERPVKFNLPPKCRYKPTDLKPFSIYSGAHKRTFQAGVQPSMASVPVPAGCAILVFAKDPQGNIVLATLQLPGASECSFSAVDTAVSLVYMTPFIAQKSAKDAIRAVKIIKACSSFKGMVKEVERVLRSSSGLPQTDSTVDTQRGKVVSEYFREIHRIYQKKDAAALFVAGDSLTPVRRLFQATTTVGSTKSAPHIDEPAEQGGLKVSYSGEDAKDYRMMIANSKRRTAKITCADSPDYANSPFPFIDPAESAISLSGLYDIVTKGIHEESLAATTDFNIDKKGQIQSQLSAVTYQLPSQIEPTCLAIDLVDVGWDVFMNFIGVKNPEKGRGWTRDRNLVVHFMKFIGKEATHLATHNELRSDKLLDVTMTFTKDFLEWAAEPDTLRLILRAVAANLEDMADGMAKELAEAVVKWFTPGLKWLDIAETVGDIIQRLWQSAAPVPGGPWTIQFTSGAPPPKVAESSTVLVMDVSDSMNLQNKLVDAKAAALDLLSFVEMMNRVGCHHQFGMVAFNHQITETHLPTTDIAAVKQNIQNLKASGLTNLVSPLEAAFAMLEKLKGVDGHIIFMTDGIHTVPDPPATAVVGLISANKNTAPVYTVGFGTDADHATLQQIADATGGEFYDAQDANKLRNAYLDSIHHATGEVVAQQDGIVKTGETNSVANTVIRSTTSTNSVSFSSSIRTGEPGSHETTTFFQSPAVSSQPGSRPTILACTLTWEQGNIEMDIKDPGGKTIDESYAGTAMTKSLNTQIVAISNPPEGAWKFSVKGVDCPPEGSSFHFTASARGMSAKPASFGGGGGEMLPDRGAPVGLIVILIILCTAGTCGGVVLYSTRKRQGLSGACVDLVLSVSSQTYAVPLSERGGLVILGRGENADVKMDDPAISARHLAIQYDSVKRSYYARDLHTTNGTYLVSLMGQTLGRWDEGPLSVGQILRIGNVTVQLRQRSDAG